MRKRIKLAICGLCVLTGCVVGQAIWPAEAHADESTFLQALSSDGLPIGPTALTLGHEVCSDIVANGVAGVDKEARLGLAAGMASDDVANFIGDAVIELCPAGLPAAKAWAAQHQAPVSVA